MKYEHKVILEVAVLVVIAMGFIAQDISNTTTITGKITGERTWIGVDIHGSFNGDIDITYSQINFTLPQGTHYIVTVTCTFYANATTIQLIKNGLGELSMVNAPAGCFGQSASQITEVSP